MRYHTTWEGEEMVDSRGLYYEDFEPKRSFTTRGRTITEADIVNFSGLSGDFNPLHTDEEFARSTPHGTRIAHGMLMASIATGLAALEGMFDGTVLALVSVSMKFTGVVIPGDRVHLVLEVVGTKKTPDGDSGIVQLKTSMFNQRDEAVSDGKWTILVKTRTWQAKEQD